MKAQTVVFVLNQHAGSYHVAEPFEEVRERWLTAIQATLEDKAAVVDLTIVTGHFDPYPLAVNPTVISQIEVVMDVSAQYSESKTHEKWQAIERELGHSSTGFASGE